MRSVTSIHNVSLDLASDIHSLFPSVENDINRSLILQIVRSADSVCANIAEGLAYPTVGMKLKQLAIAYGSAQETISHLIQAQRLGMITTEQCSYMKAGYTNLLFRLKALCRYFVVNSDYKGGLSEWALQPVFQRKNNQN